MNLHRRTRKKRRERGKQGEHKFKFTVRLLPGLNDPNAKTLKVNLPVSKASVREVLGAANVRGNEFTLSLLSTKGNKRDVTSYGNLMMPEETLLLTPRTRQKP